MSRGVLILASVSMAFSAGAWAGTEGSSSTFYGQGAGAAANSSLGNSTYLGLNAGNKATGSFNTLVGAYAGYRVTTGTSNAFLGVQAGPEVTTGFRNTILGASAGGWLQTGTRNVFIGYGAGYYETGSDRLYIDNCIVGACLIPLIYGEFDNRRLHFDGVVGVTANQEGGVVKSQLHFSVTGGDVGGWLTSASENNFFTSSGARYDAGAGGWIQRSTDGKAVISGSGAAGFRVLTSSGGAVGGVVVPVSRLHIDYAGLMGVNTAPTAGRAINTSTGAYLSSGGVWTNASSRELKDDIERLSAEEAQQAFAQLDPVRFRYKEGQGSHVGFIAEDVPELVATADRKGLSPMDVVAVLTKVVQGQAGDIARMRQRHAAEMAEMRERLRRLESQ